MPFPRKLLNDREDIVLDLRPHWWFLFKPTFVVLVIAGLVIGINVAFEPPDAALIAMLVVLAAGLVYFVARYLEWVTTNFVVTTERIVSRKGVIAKRGVEIPLERINDITFNQGIFERIIGSGDLRIESGSGQGQQRFYDISKPSIVQNVIYREMEASQARDHDRMAGKRTLSIPEQIEKLDELRQRGVITPAEFDAKKQQLLDQM